MDRRGFLGSLFKGLAGTAAGALTLVGCGPSEAEEVTQFYIPKMRKEQKAELLRVLYGGGADVSTKYARMDHVHVIPSDLIRSDHKHPLFVDGTPIDHRHGMPLQGVFTHVEQMQDRLVFQVQMDHLSCEEQMKIVESWQRALKDIGAILRTEQGGGTWIVERA